VLSIAPLYGLRYSPASCRLPPSDIQDKPPTVQVGHYGRPTVTLRIRNDTGGETPGHYIRAHLNAPNPFVEGRISLNGPTYHSEIHAAAIHDLDVPPPPITADILRLLDTIWGMTA
jgi:hypothetical protein